MSQLDRFGSATLKEVSSIKQLDFDKAGLAVTVIEPPKAPEWKPESVRGDAMEAAKEEVKKDLKDKVVFNFDGDTYTVPKAEKWSIRVLRELEDNKIATAIELLLGDDQWERFADDHTVEDASKLFEAMNKASGSTTGE